MSVFSTHLDPSRRLLGGVMFSQSTLFYSDEQESFKICTKCGMKKPLVSYAVGKRYKGGRINHCRECVFEKNKKIKDKHRQLYSAIDETVTVTCNCCKKTKSKVFFS